MILDSFRLTPDDCVVPLVPCERTTMLDNLGSLLLGIIIGAVASVGMLAWRDSRRDDHAAEDAAREFRE